MFFQILIAMLLGLASPCNSTHTGTVTTQDAPPTGGDDGHTPPPK